MGCEVCLDFGHFAELVFAGAYNAKVSEVNFCCFYVLMAAHIPDGDEVDAVEVHLNDGCVLEAVECVGLVFKVEAGEYFAVDFVKAIYADEGCAGFAILSKDVIL